MCYTKKERKTHVVTVIYLLGYAKQLKKKMIELEIITSEEIYERLHYI